MKLRILALSVLLLVAAACSQAPKTEPESFTLAGQKVAFAPPPTTWSRTTQEIPPAYELQIPKEGETPKDGIEAKELSGGDLIRFTPPWSEGFLTVSAIKNWQDEELTEAHIRHLQNAVLKREKGKVDSQEEGRLGDAAGYKMSFHYMDRGKETRGVQIHVIRKGVYCSVVLSVPADRWGQAEPVYSNLVDSWKFE